MHLINTIKSVILDKEKIKRREKGEKKGGERRERKGNKRKKKEKKEKKCIPGASTVAILVRTRASRPTQLRTAHEWDVRDALTGDERHVRKWRTRA